MSSIPYKTDLKNNQNLFPNSYQKQTKGEVFLPGETAKPFPTANEKHFSQQVFLSK